MYIAPETFMCHCVWTGSEWNRFASERTFNLQNQIDLLPVLYAAGEFYSGVTESHKFPIPFLRN
jgi:hypothetical protein